MSNEDKIENENKDLTNISDLSDFEHVEDPETDQLLREQNKESSFSQLPSLEGLDVDLENVDDSPPEFDYSESNLSEDLSLDENEDKDNDEEEDQAKTFDEENQEDQLFEEEISFAHEEDSIFSNDDSGDHQEEAFSGEDNTNLERKHEIERELFSSSEFNDPEFSDRGSDDSEHNNSEFDTPQFNDSEFNNSEFDDSEFKDSEYSVSHFSNHDDPSTSDGKNTKRDHSEPRAMENFQDLRDFGNSITYGNVGLGGNPPFTLIIRSIQYEEDAEDIMIVLREHGIADHLGEDNLKQGLQQGSIIIPQISEYSAIYLSHRLRRFSVSIEMGLSDEIFPSKSYAKESKGLISKFGLKQNINENIDVEKTGISTEDIMLTSTPLIEGHHILHYLDIVSSHTIIKEDELRHLHQQQLFNEDSSVVDHYSTNNEEQEDYMNSYKLGINLVYHELGQELKNEAFKIEANAIVGVNYQITPLMGNLTQNQHGEYKITCTGNAVWIVKN